MEEVIAKMMTDCEEQAKDSRLCPVTIRANKAVLPAMLRALGSELDMHTDPSRILDGFMATTSNFVASLVGMLVEDDGRVPAMQVALAILARDLAMRADPSKLPANSRAHINFDIPEEGTA